MKRVLLISYYFPPMPAVGALRAKGLAKYLPEFGWEVTVLHGSLTNKGSLIHRLFGIDPNQNMLAQAQELQRKVKVPIGWALKLYAEWLKYPDAMGKEWWAKEFIEKLAYEHEDKNEIHAIISTSPPVGCHIAANEISIALYNHMCPVPWIADFRDLWTQNHYYPYSCFRLYRERKLEQATLGLADKLVTVSGILSARLGVLHNRAVDTIMNGYDPDEVRQGDEPPEHVVTYTGTIYPNKQSVDELVDYIGKQYPRTPRFAFYGPYSSELAQKARERGVDGAITQYGIVSREEALNKQRMSEQLLLLKWQGASGIFTNKLFEYAAARRRVLAIGAPDAFVDAVVADINAGNIEQYSQREMARKFARLLDKVVRQ